jgi:UDP-N-acetylglucosamine 2-epimerase
MPKRLRVLLIFGTRPEAIKLAPLLWELQARPTEFEPVVCVTAQHRAMLDQVLDVFRIKPDYDLNVMRDAQSLFDITTSSLTRLEPVLRRVAPDWIVVQGDTTTVMTAALAAFYLNLKIAHVEAGLRSGDKRQPWPEEINRRICDLLADLYLAPTPTARDNLLAEHVPAERIAVTGNTVIDTLLTCAQWDFDWAQSPLRTISRERRIILVTAHRRENFGEPFAEICRALAELAQRYRDAQIVYPLHRNPNIWGPAHQSLAAIPNIMLLEPLDYLSFVHLMKSAYLVLTDSGGVQEEAPSLGKPVLVLRQTTERPEGVAAGTTRLVGVSRQKILESAAHLMDDEIAYQQMAQAVNPYGDGRASQRIAAALLERAHQ